MTQPSPSTVKRIALRLDNGTLIAAGPKWGATGEKQAVMIHYEEGFEKGVVTDADVKRMSSVLGRLNDNLRKRKAEQLSTVASLQPQLTAPKLSDVKRPKPKPLRETPSWVPKCRDIVQKILKQQDKSAIFSVPVPLDKVTDYRKVIVIDNGSRLMDLGTLLRNLNAGHYLTAEEFADDMDTIWINCDLYNGPTSDIGRLGTYCKQMWMRLWEKAGFAPRMNSLLLDPRGKRPPIGSAPSRWDPAQPEPSDSRRSRGGKQRSAQPRTSDQHDGVQRKGAGEVVSSGHAMRVMDGDRLKALGAALEEMDEHAMEGIIEIVRATGQFDGMEEDEMELDLDNLAPEALWKLDDYAKQVTGGRYNPDAALESAGRVHRGPQVEGDSDDDSDDD